MKADTYIRGTIHCFLKCTIRLEKSEPGDSHNLLHTSTVPVVGVGKEECTLLGPWDYLIMHTTFNRTNLRTSGPVLTDSIELK